MAASAHCLGMAIEATRLSLCLVDQAGTIVAELDRGHGDAIGSEPADWWRACRTGVKDLLRRAGLNASAIRAIGLSGDPGVLVMTDKTGKALGPVTFTADPAAAPGIALLHGAVGARNFTNLTGRQPGLASSVVKLLHARTGAKRAWHDTVRLLPAKDWLRLRLTGVAATDAAEASGTLLFNPKARAWSKQLLAPLDIDPALMPAVLPADAISGRVEETAARETGLQVGTPVVAGAGHAAAVAIAAGVHAPGVLVVELGRGGALVALASEHAKAGDLLQPACHALDGHLRHAFAADGSAAVAWLLDRQGDAAPRRAAREPMELAIEAAAEVPAGAGGLIFVPERDPAQPGPGAFANQAKGHGLGHQLRACLEAGALQARQALAESGASEVVAIGPGASQPERLHLLADACGRPVAPVQIDQPAAFAAAILAACAVGIHKTPAEATARMVKRRPGGPPRKRGVEAFARQADALAALVRPSGGAGGAA